jgi:UDP-GlcNAc:undecaprenyl-phosphate GlcNAc-1-phosphate transferase
MLVGLILGVLAMRSWVRDTNSISVAVPIVLMAIPLFDSSMAIIRRKLTGRSVFTVDRGHLHHNLMRFGIKNRWLVGVITLLSFVTASGAVLGVVFQSDVISVLTLLFAIGSLVATRVFGFAECELVLKRCLNFSKSLIAPHGVSDNRIRQQGSRKWETVWDTMIEFAAKHNLSKISLDLNMPWLHEGFHASWHKNKMPDVGERWQVRLPVVSQERILGRIEAFGKYDTLSSFPVISALAEMLEELQPCILDVVNDFEALGIPPDSVIKPRLIGSDAETLVDIPSQLDVAYSTLQAD